MAKLGINTGSTANDGTGDTLREAGGKINTNFDEVYSTIGDGTNLFTGIVTSITAGNFISVSAATGSVTIAGLANTENINAESLVVSGISTLGLITSSNTLGIGTIFATRVEATGAIIGNTFVGDGAQLTGLATTERVVTTSLVVSGITTVGIVTGATSIGVDKLYATSLYGDGSNIVGIQYADVAGIATYATNAGVATYATNAGVATYSDTSGISTFATTAGISTLAIHATTAGVSSYTSSWIVGEDPTNNSHYRFTGPGVSTDQDDPELYLVRGEVYRFTNQMGRHPIQIQTDSNGGVGGTYTDGVTGNGVINGDLIFDVQFDAPRQLYYQCTTHNTMGGSIRILNNQSDLADYATNAGVATYATNAGVATYATNAGVSSYSDVTGIATYATNAGVATYATNAGVATYASLAGLSTNATFAGYATTAGIATVANTATFSTNAGVATYATNAGVATYASNAGVSTTSGYATNAGIATAATTANYATNAGVATVATNAQGLTGTPNIDVGYSIVELGLNVLGVSTLGIVTGATYYGDGTNLSNVVKINSVQSFQNLEVTGVSTLGILTGVQSLTTNDLYATDIVAATFSGDGSGLTSVTASASVGLKLDDVFVGGGFTSIDFRHEGEQITTFTGVGNSAIFTTNILASTADTRSNTLVVTGVSTLGIVTNVTSIDVSNLYVNNLTASNIYGNADGSDTVLTVTDNTSTSARRVAFINDNDPGVSNYETVNVGNLQWTPDTGILTGVTTYFGGRVEVTDVYASGIVSATTLYGDGSNLTGVVASGTGIIVQDSGSIIGTAGTINFGDNLSVSALSAGAVTVTAATGTASTANVSTNTLVVAGVSTLASVTVTSISGDGSGLTGVGTFSGNYNDLSNQPTIPSNTSDLSNDSGFITNQVVGIITAVAFRGSGAELVDGKWTLGAVGSDHYTFTGVGFTQTTNDPDLYLSRGRTYQFVNPLNAHGFQIQDTQNGTIGNPYNNGVTNNGSQLGTIEIEVPFNAPDTLYYQCVSHTGMGGTIFIYPTLR